MHCVFFSYERERVFAARTCRRRRRSIARNSRSKSGSSRRRRRREEEAPEEPEPEAPLLDSDESDDSGLQAALRSNSPTSVNVNLNASIGRASPPSPTRSPSSSPSPSPPSASSSTPPSRSMGSAFDNEFDQIQRLLESKPSPQRESPQSHSQSHRSPTCSPRASPSSSPPSSPSALLVRTSTLSPAGNSHSAHPPIVIQLARNSALLAQLSAPLNNSPPPPPAAAAAAAVDGERELKPDVLLNSNANANSNSNSNASVVPAMRFSPLKPGSALQQFLNEPTSSASLLDAASLSPHAQIRSTPTTPISARSSPAPSAPAAGSSPSLVYVKAKVSAYSRVVQTFKSKEPNLWFRLTHRSQI